MEFKKEMNKGKKKETTLEIDRNRLLTIQKKLMVTAREAHGEMDEIVKGIKSTFIVMSTE